MIAYTVGKTDVYDPHIANSPNAKKIGKRDDYLGGWVWSNYNEAQQFADDLTSGGWAEHLLPEGHYSVYEIRLPKSFEKDTYLPENDTILALLHDAKIIRKIEKEK